MSVEGLTEDEVRALPVCVPLVTAGRAFLMGRTKAHELARKKAFPCEVLRLSGAYVVRKTDLMAALRLPLDSEPDTTAA